MEHLPLEILGEIASHLKNPEDLSNFVSSFKKVNELKKNVKLMNEVQRKRYWYDVKKKEYMELQKKQPPSKFDL